MLQTFFKSKYFFIYLLVMSVCGFVVMGIDKRKAKKAKWRIKEKTLFFFALAGGSVGSILGMYTFHHKTKHWYFVIGFPAILLVQIALYIYFIILK